MRALNCLMPGAQIALEILDLFQHLPIGNAIHCQSVWLNLERHFTNSDIFFILIFSLQYIPFLLEQ